MRLLEYFQDFPTHIDLNPFHAKSTWTPPQHGGHSFGRFYHCSDTLNVTPKPVSENLQLQHANVMPLNNYANALT